jgi:hypothetical protein
VKGFILKWLLQIVANNRCAMMYSFQHGILVVDSTGEVSLKLELCVMKVCDMSEHNYGHCFKKSESDDCSGLSCMLHMTNGRCSF